MADKTAEYPSPALSAEYSSATESASNTRPTVAESSTSHVSNGGSAVAEDDFFTTDEPQTKRIRRDGWGRYKLINPETGLEQAWQRVTTFARMAADGYGLEQWSLRMVVKGLAMRPDLLALAATFDVKTDAKKLNQIADQAKEYAGGSAAANLGTALHAFSESVDVADNQQTALLAVPAPYRPDVAAYVSEMELCGLRAVPTLVERVTAVLEYGVAGTFDNVLQCTRDLVVQFKDKPAIVLREGDYIIGDKKTGKDLSHSQIEILVQLWLYARGVNSIGVWDLNEERWSSPVRVRNDVAMVMHIPAGTGGCTIYPVDLSKGSGATELCASVRAHRKTRDVFSVLDPDITLRETADKHVDQDLYTSMLERFSSIRTKAEGSELYRAACEEFGMGSYEVRRLVEAGKAALS